MVATKRRSARKVAERKRSIYFEPDSDDDFEVADNENEHDFQPEPEAGPSAPQQRSRKRRKTIRKLNPDTRGKERRRQRFKGNAPRRRKKKFGVTWISSTSSKNNSEVIKGFTGPSNGTVPDWTRLPADILRDIFVFASHPIHEQMTTASANVTWLIRSARTCRAFALPALEAYYTSPSILTRLHPHSLYELVCRPQESLYMNYKYRVKSLEIDVKRVAYSAHSRRPFQVDTILRELPRLQDLQILHPMHTPPYRPVKVQSWVYPLDFASSLEMGNVRLKAFRWSRDMIPVGTLEEIYPWITQVHTSKPFDHLERLVVCGFNVHDSGDLRLEKDPASKAPGLASAISALPHLKDLTFISCDTIMENFLEHIPKNLERLELDNCLEVTSDMLYTFLAMGGSHLKELVLNHNAALTLAYSQHLKALCPRLELLKMDLTYYSERMNFNDAWAIYDVVLKVDQVPTWPSTLRHLELVHLQKLEAEAAQNLFQSLVESARDLPDLRHLALQAHINIPWRDRAGFRDQWIERLQRVYLREVEDPNPNLGSLKQFRLWKEANDANTKLENDKFHQTDAPVIRRRKMSHVQTTPRKLSPDIPIYSDTPVESSPRNRPRRSARVAESQSVSTAAEEESSSESSEESGNEWRKQPEAFVQGLCDVVDIRIDNQRPRENQYTEANFLDSEPSGDEDWQSGQELSDDGYAW